MSLVASEIRTLHRKAAQLDRRLALANLSGKVHPGSQDPEKRTVRLELGKTSDGKPILSPPVRWQQPGAGGGLKTHSQPANGEQMTLQSPSGTVGSGSLAVWGSYDKDTDAPSKAGDAAVWQIGATTITAKGDGLEISSGGVTLRVSGDGVAATGGKLTHDGKNVGSDHKHKGVLRGAANTDEPV